MLERGPGGKKPAACRREPLVLLHGFLGCPEDWLPLMERFEGGRRCLAPELPVPAGADRAAFEECAGALLQDLEGRIEGAFHLTGYSMGGRLALDLALRHPGRLRSLCLLAASPGIVDERERSLRRRRELQLAAGLEREGLEAFLEDWYDQPLFRSFSSCEAFPSALRRRRSLDAGRQAGLLRGLGAGIQENLWPALGRLARPLLFLAGELDHKYVELGRRLAAACPAARLEIVAAAGHALHLEATEGCAKRMRNFLEEVEESSDG